MGPIHVKPINWGMYRVADLKIRSGAVPLVLYSLQLENDSDNDSFRKNCYRTGRKDQCVKERVGAHEDMCVVFLGRNLRGHSVLFQVF